MATYAVPMLAIVEADTADQAYEITNLRVQNPLLGSAVTVLIDERLDAFAFDPEAREVHSALDREA